MIHVDSPIPPLSEMCSSEGRANKDPAQIGSHKKGRGPAAHHHISRAQETSLSSVQAPEIQSQEKTRLRVQA